MTRAPVPRENGDLLKALQVLDQINDKIDRLETRGDARQTVTTEDIAQLAAELRRVGNTASSALAENQRGYAEATTQIRALGGRLDAIGERVASLENKGVEGVKEATHEAVERVVDMNREEEIKTRKGVHRAAGLAIAGGGGAVFVGAVNLVLSNWKNIAGMLKWFAGAMVNAPSPGP